MRVLRASVARPTQAADVVAGHLARHGWDGLTAAAVRHGVAARVHQAVVAAGHAADPQAVELAEEAQRAGLQLVRAGADLARLTAVLATAGVEVTAVKGPALVAQAYRTPGDRGCGDLDVLVAPVDLGPALGLLEAAGYRSLDQNWSRMRELLVGQVRLRSPSAGVVDLHWHLLNDRALRQRFDLGHDVWAAARAPLQVGGTTVHALQLPLALVHVGLHAALSGAHRLVWLQDVAAFQGRPDLDWDAVVRTARRVGAGPALALVLQRARSVGGDTPAGVLSDLDPVGAWRAVAAATDRLAPPGVDVGRGSVGQLVARSSRPTGAASLREVVRRTAAWARPGARRGALTAAELFDPTSATSMSHPSGGPEGRRAYIAAVHAQQSAAALA